jgi:hypothetical protein
MRKSGVSLGHQAFDLTVKAVLGHYAADAKREADWAFLYSNKETYEKAKDAEERFKSAAEAADKIAILRDTDQVYRDNNDPKRLPGDIVPAMDAAKLTVKALLFAVLPKLGGLGSYPGNGFEVEFVNDHPAICPRSFTN